MRGGLLPVLLAAWLAGCAGLPEPTGDPAPAATVTVLAEPPAEPPAPARRPEGFPVWLKLGVHEASALAWADAQAARKVADGAAAPTEYARLLDESGAALRRLLVELASRPEKSSPSGLAFGAQLEALGRLLAAEGACLVDGNEGACADLVGLRADEDAARRAARAAAREALAEAAFELDPREWDALARLRADGVAFNREMRATARAWESATRAGAWAPETARPALDLFDAWRNATQLRTTGVARGPHYFGDAEEAWHVALRDGQSWIADARACADGLGAREARAVARCARANATARGPLGDDVLAAVDAWGTPPLTTDERRALDALQRNFSLAERRYLAGALRGFRLWQAEVRTGEATDAELAALRGFVEEVRLDNLDATPPRRFVALQADWDGYLRAAAVWIETARDCVHNGDRACPAELVAYATMSDAATLGVAEHLRPFYPVPDGP